METASDGNEPKTALQQEAETRDRLVRAALAKGKLVSPLASASEVAKDGGSLAADIMAKYDIPY